MKRIEFSSHIPVALEADVCVLGGSCTGVFAALRAAELGASVAIVERGNRFGGTATLSQVCYWHSLFDLENKNQIIRGLTQTVIDRLVRRNAVELNDGSNPSWYARLDTEELAIELDEMVKEAQIHSFLHCSFAAPILEEGKPAAVVIAGKNGLEAIKAKVFVDATGDGDLCAALGFELWRNEFLQPPTMCAKFNRYSGFENIGKLIHDAKEKYRLPEGFVWGTKVPNSDTYLLAGTKIPDSDLSTRETLTEAEFEGRRQIRAIQDIIAEAGLPRPVLEALPSLIGIRDTRHITALHKLTRDELLGGKIFDDAIARGTYRVDIHSQEPPGTRFLYLDGKEVFLSPHQPHKEGFWRDPSLPSPAFYTIPLRSIIPAGSTNVITAGRMIDADAAAFGAVRVMVTMNQTGEAAGAVAALAADSGRSVDRISVTELSYGL